jgi:hypothetical protein
MKYDITTPVAPIIPVLGAHISGAEFQHPNLTWKELCGQMANLVADSGCKDYSNYYVKHGPGAKLLTPPLALPLPLGIPKV